MSLKLIYNGQTTIPVEIEGLTPCAVREKSIGELERFEIFHGNRKAALADFFQVSGDASDGRMELEGDLSGVHWIGAGMTDGQIVIDGKAGRHLGSEMRGGMIDCRGDAGGWVGAEMFGGLIHVRGSAGHLVGAAYRGSAVGMRGGTILIDGNAGNEVGLTMRRGMVAVGGTCGDVAGFNMISGSIFVFGDAGIRPGAGMRRGTIGFFSDAPPPMLPSFRRGALAEPLFLRLAFLNLQRRGFQVDDGLLNETFQFYHGDFIEGGRGEIIVRRS
ncbi:MAG: formylmethanofuran dehydrogenase subunit C [Pirellulales bacterium]|nr:formylmethanofuran dehydrogenase subunit C [Pirellulales bacterium]